MPISNERPSPFARKPFNRRPPFGGPASHPPFASETIKSEILQIERKSYLFTLNENPRGRFLRISEANEARRDSIIIPGEGIEDFAKVFDEMFKASAEIPPKPTSSPLPPQL